MKGLYRRMLGTEALLLLEIALLFGLAHLSFRAFRAYTSLGQAEVARGWVISPGLCFMLAAYLGLRGARLRLRDLGLRREEFWPQLGHAFRLPFSILRDMARPWSRKIMGLYFLLALTWSLLMLLAGDAAISLLGFAVFSVLAFGFLAADDEFGRRVLPLSQRVTAGVLGLLLLAWFAVIPLERAIPELIWIVGFSALGEELFFRGYVQSRCNQLYGRPWSVGITRYGPGVYVAAALFGVIHLINPWNYFTGSGSLAWGAGILSGLSLYLGFTFERTGSLIAPVALHAIGNLLIRIGRELAG